MSVTNNKFRDSKHGIHINIDHLHDSFLHRGYEDENIDDEELIRVVLRRRNPFGSSSSAAAACSYDKVIGKTFSMRADLEDEKKSSSSSSSSGIVKAVRRAFSMRASSANAKEVYRRIDHQYDSVPVADEENTIMVAQTQSESDKKGNKILEACRRFFGF